MPNQSVYIALNNAKVCMYQTETPSKEPRVRRGTVRTVVGYKAPKLVTLRSRKLFCMVFTKENQELWASENHCIDVIDVKSFKVDTSKTISLRILLSEDRIQQISDVNSGMNVVQMVRSPGRVWCLLKNSPFILEFCEESYNCLSLLKCDQEMLLKVNVRKVLDFDEATHATYHQLQRTGDTSDSSDTEDGDYMQSLLASAEGGIDDDDGIYEDYYTGKIGENSRQRRRLTNTRQTLPGFNHSQDNAPPVPLRNVPKRPDSDGSSPPVPERNTDDVPPIPKRNTEDAPPIPKRTTSQAPLVPLRREVRLPVPSRTFPRDTKPPPFTDMKDPPPVPDKASTLPKTHSSGSQSGSGRRPNSGPELPPKSPSNSQTQFGQDPKEYRPQSKLSNFSIIVSSLECVGNSLWIGRSNGEVCVIDIRLPTAGQSNCGKVVAIFQNKLRKYSVLSDENVKLIKAGRYVVATYSGTASDIIETQTEIALWDALDVADVERIQSYWTKINYIEKKISEETKKVAVNLGTV